MDLDPEKLRLELAARSFAATRRREHAGILQRRLILGVVFFLLAAFVGGLAWVVVSDTPTPISDGRRWLSPGEPAARRLPATLR